jgi:hypothetical protein
MRPSFCVIIVTFLTFSFVLFAAIPCFFFGRSTLKRAPLRLLAPKKDPEQPETRKRCACANGHLEHAAQPNETRDRGFGR